MEKKNKATKLINTALGLIVIIAVVLCSPLFGYGRGLASKEQRRAAAEAPAGFSTGYVAAPMASVTATPRPTAQPTLAPVVLPSAPPAPDPTPQPTRPPQAAVQQTVQQPVQQNWQQEEVPEGEAEAAEESGEAAEESGALPEGSYGIGEQATTTESGSQIIATEGADIVIGGAATQENTEPVYESAPVEQPVQEAAPAVVQETVPDAGEAELFTIG